MKSATYHKPRRRAASDDTLLFWRCAALCELASGQFALSVVERSVIKGVMACYRQGRPINRQFGIAAEAILREFKQRRRSAVLEAAKGRNVRRVGRRLGRHRVKRPDAPRRSRPQKAARR